MRRSGRGSTYSALQSRGGDGFFTYDPSVGEGERTVFPCTKSAMNVGGPPPGGPLLVIRVPQQNARRLG